MRVIRIDYDDIVNGPGVRAVVWVSGCLHKCKGCHNPQTWDKDAGEEMSDSDVESLLEYIGKPYVHGVTFTGGDPLEKFNIKKVCSLAKKVKTKYPEKSVWVYTGYLWEDLFEQIDSYHRKCILTYIDVVVDGRFQRDRKVSGEFRGSLNQRLVDVRKTGTGRVRIWEERFGKYDGN